MRGFRLPPSTPCASLRSLVGLAGGGGRHLSATVAAAESGFDAGQADAVGAVCGTRRLEVIVGPAGAGKTRMLAAAHEYLAAQGGAVVVVSPTRKGALVAGAEIGVPGAAVSKLLHEHGFRWDRCGRWKRLEQGAVDPATGRAYTGPGEDWILSERSVVVVDEAGLLSVDQAVALIDIASETGAAVRLVGDPRQLGAVGRGGVMETAARWAADGAVLLDQVHRFLTAGVDATGMPTVTTDTGYAALTLALREGADPDAVVGRLVDAGHVTVHPAAGAAVAAIAAQVAAHIDHHPGTGSTGSGGGDLAVTVATNDHADELNTAVRALRVASGHVDDTITTTGMGGATVGVGDRVVTRRNDTTLGVANRDTWTVTHITGDGTLVAAPLGSSHHRQVRLDPGYVTAHVQLGYATPTTATKVSPPSGL